MEDWQQKTFKILERAPVAKMGMNLKLIYKIESEDNWRRIEDNLAPKLYWEDPLPKRAGLSSMTVESPRPDDLRGFIKVSFGPGGMDFSGVRFDVNNHVELKLSKDDDGKGYDAASILSGHWDKSLIFAKNACETILLKAIKS